jgi:hypothetical protein
VLCSSVSVSVSETVLQMQVRGFSDERLLMLLFFSQSCPLFRVLSAPAAAAAAAISSLYVDGVSISACARQTVCRVLVCVNCGKAR